MTNPHGEFIWFELLTSDPDSAQGFYGDILGWTAGSHPSGAEMDYRILSAPDGEGVAGLMKMPEGMAPGPIWLGYVGVDDVDASVAHIEGAGGTISMPAMTMDGVGRMAMVTDQQGAPFYVMRGESDEASTAFKQGDDGVGHGVWAELSSRDPAAAKAFYGDAFGWRQDGAILMGPLGDYEFLHAGDIGFGAVMPVQPEGHPGWLYYFHVSDIDVAAAKIASGGGTIVQPPTEIPGGNYSLVATDPQGAAFGLAGPRI